MQSDTLSLEQEKKIDKIKTLRDDPLSVLDSVDLPSDQRELVTQAREIQQDPLQVALESDKISEDQRKQIKMARDLKTDPAAVLEELGLP